MPSVSTEGIILKRTNFGEADRVLTILTDRFGKISVIARGVRRITSRRAGHVEVLNWVKLHLFKSKNYNLSEAESLETFPKIKSDLTLSTYAFHILELIDRLLPEDEINKLIFNLTKEILGLLEKSPRQIFIRAFEVKLLSFLGFWDIRGVGEVNSQTAKLLQTLQTDSWNKISQIKIAEEQSLVLERILRYYIERILEAKLKSVQVMKDIKHG